MGVEECHYKDKKVGKNVNEKGSLQNLVNEEFKKIEKQHGVGFRDDQEIRNAGWNTIAKMIDEIKKDKSMVYGPWGLGPLVDLSNKLKKEYNDMKGCKLFTNNADKIHQVAQSIDNAEKEALTRLRRNRTIQDTRNIAAKVEKDKTGTPMFITEKSKDGKDTGNLVFTEAANPVRIDQALKGLFNDPNKVYIIDYSQCDTSTPQGRAIKQKMTQLIGAKTCYLRYDKDQKTYTIRGTSGEGISNRAYIRKGVRLIPDGVRQRDAYIEEKRGNNQIGKFDDKWVESQVNLFLKDVPSAKKLTDEQKKRLISKTESRVNELLRKAKSLGYELETEPVTKKWFGKGHMELHLISGTSEVDRPFWENVVQIGPDLSEFIDKNEGEYAKYLTKRVHNRWNQMDKLTKTESVDVKSDVKDEKDKIADKNSIIYGLSKFEEMIDNFRGSEGDSWMDKDDRRLVRIKTILRDGKKSLNDADDIGKKAIEKNIIIPLRIEWSTFKRIPSHITDKDGNTIDNPNWKAQRQYLNNVFFGSTEQQLKAIREMGSLNRRFDKTETSFIAEEIANGIDMEIENEDGTKSRVLETNDELMNKFIKNIESIFTFKDDEVDNMKNNDNPRKILIDEIYNYKIGDKEGNLDGFIKLFVENGMFPAGWESHPKNIRDLVKEKFKQLKKTLDNNIAQINSLSIEGIAKEQHEERLMLEQKENKTEDDIKKLQGLIYLENNKSEQEKINKNSLEETKLNLKYGNIDNIIKGTLFPIFAELGGGAKGRNADIYNDIKGIGNWNLSDENAKWVGEMVAEIAITVAVAVATGGAGAALMQGMLRGTAKAVAKIGALAFLAPKIYRIAEVAYMGYKSLKRGGKAIKLVYSSVSLLAEGTIFNAVSTAIRSAASGTSFDGLNLNPIAQENIKTAAFLGALSIGNKLGMKVLTKLHSTTKIEAFSQAGLKDVLKNYKGIWTESLISEATAMFGAEQGMNFVFGHDVYNSETGEIEKKRSLTRPTQQEWIQMMGMLLAFKMVKPQLWHNYAQKLNEGTLEICRGVKKNEVLIRNSKTGKLEKIQDLIDGHYNNYKPTPEQYQLRNHNQRLEKQSKYNTEYSQARDEIIRLPENLRSQAMKKFIETGDMIEQSPNDIKRIQREIGLTGKDVDGVVGPQTLEKLKKYVSKGGESKEVVNDKTVEKARESLYDKFDAGIMSKNGLTMDGITYKLERKPYEGQNQSHKGRIIYTETGPDGQIKFKVEANSNTFVLPENSNGNKIRGRFNAAREKYVSSNLDNATQAFRQKRNADISPEKDRLTNNQAEADAKAKAQAEADARAKAQAQAEAARERQVEPKKQSNERPERGVNTERREMSEVHRNSDVVAIGDLHGQYIALKGNMEFAGLAREVNGHLEWTGGNKKVVFQGDILADRGTDGLRIIKEIHNLREQARKQGGDIDIIVGNHDDFMISFLTQRGGVHLNGIEGANHPEAPTQGLGLTELANFIGGKAGNFDIIRGQQNNILKAMRQSPEGRLILEEICNMKLVSQVDDVLYIHTNPTDAILNFLTSRGEGNVQKMINAINSKYQNYLRIMLLGEGNITSQQMKEFNGLSDLFLNTDNRITSQKLDYYQKLRNSGINMISHGHSGGSAIPENTVDLGDWKRHYLYEGNQANIGGVKIVDTDYSYGKRGGNEGQHSVSIVKKEGGVNYIGDNVAYANLEYPIGTEVYVTRSNGGESIAKVDSYNPTTKEYRVVWEEGGKIRYKDVTSESLRNIPGEQERIQRGQKEIEHRERDQIEEQQRKVQEKSEKQEIDRKINNFNNENGRFELLYYKEISNGKLMLKEGGVNKGELNFSIRDNCVYIDGLVSFEKGSGTQLMKKLVEISELVGKGGHIEATASPYVNTSGQQSYRGQMTNLGFYYKLGFEAKNPEIHRQIQEYIRKGEEIPLKLNALTDIYLTDKGITDLKSTKKGTKIDMNKKKKEAVNTVEREISLDGNNLKNIVSIDANGNVNFKHEYVTSNTVEIEGQKYKIFEEGKGDGIGCMVREGKSIQIGNFVNGKLEGKGIQIHGNGNKYEGNFVNGEFEGKGTYTWASGEKYEGEFKNGKYEGEGKRYDTNGNLRYEGEFKNGEYEGKGKEYNTNGNPIYEGEFKNGKYEGKGTYTFASGDKYEGEFMRGQLRNGIEISNNGGIKKVKFVGDVTKDQMNGLTTHIKPGETAEIELVNGEKVTIKNIEGKFEEWLGNSGEIEFSLPIEGKLGEYLEKRIYNEHNSSEIQPERDQIQIDEAARERQVEPKKQSNERPERGVNTERREMAEVPRNSDVIAIGDLHGEYIALKGNMEFAGLAREVNGHLEWTGGNKKVVFQGDILADRGTDGLRIIKEIHNLREQARKQGGDIDIIVGNHDDFMIAYLLGGKVSRFARPGQTSSGLDIAMINGQGQGLTELLDFIGIKRTGEYRDFFQLGDKNHDILNAMRNSPEGKLILEEICNMKLVSQVDDVLYCHTNPTARMLQYLTNGNIQGNIKLLNQKYQGYLREKLLGEGSGNISLDEFNNISDIFLNTGNRNISGVETYMGALKSSGINMISHGHSGGSPYRSTEIGGVKIVDTDYTYGKYGELDHEHSVSIVKKENGNIELGEYGNNEYIGKTIDFHLGDRRQYRGTIEGIQGVGQNLRLTIKYIDPQYGEQTTHPLLSDIKNWGGYRIAA